MASADLPADWLDDRRREDQSVHGARDIALGRLVYTGRHHGARRLVVRAFYPPGRYWDLDVSLGRNFVRAQALTPPG